MRALVVTSSMLVFALGLAACGGKKPAETSGVAEKPAAKEEPEKKEPAKTEPPKETPHERKAAKEFLTVPGWDFLLSFKDSDLKAKADEECEKKSKGDEAAAKECVAAAAAEAANDRLKLTTDDRGGLWFIYMGKSKGKEILYTKLQYKIAKEETDKLVLTPVGSDQGKAAMKKLPKEIVLEMPDEYQVVFQHPSRGKLVFNVKVSEEGPAGPEKKHP